ncbi:MAG TPA: hypothetical protein VK324_01800, partial [Tepidisphaeraceae bacterium]|nr:hypothetical protein [Tepidisphaeraceae bacterium]
RLLAIAAGAGLALGSLLAIGLGLRDPRPADPETLAASTGVQVLGHVPAPLPAGQAWAEGTPAAGAFDAVAAALGSARTVAITSVTDGPAAFVAAALAAALARAGHRTLLIDADLRGRGCRHLVGNAGPSHGLLDLLRGHGTPGNDPIIPAPAAGLDYMPSGADRRANSDRSDLFNSPAFDTLVVRLARSYDRIVLLTPPADSNDDARVIASVCDGAVLAGTAGSLAQRDVEDLRNGLADVGANLLGVIQVAPTRAAPQPARPSPMTSRGDDPDDAVLAAVQSISHGGGFADEQIVDEDDGLRIMQRRPRQPRGERPSIRDSGG